MDDRTETLLAQLAAVAAAQQQALHALALGKRDVAVPPLLDARAMLERVRGALHEPAHP